VRAQIACNRRHPARFRHVLELRGPSVLGELREHTPPTCARSAIPPARFQATVKATRRVPARRVWRFLTASAAIGTAIATGDPGSLALNDQNDNGPAEPANSAARKSGGGEGGCGEPRLPQVIEAFPYDTAPRFLHRDRDGVYGSRFVARVEVMGVGRVISAPRAPWQNPFVERVIGSIRRECTVSP
jgi:hypothetical protein